MKRIISLPGSPPRISEVTVKAGLVEDLPETLPERLEDRSAYWIWDERVWSLWHRQLKDWDWPDIEEAHLIRFSFSETGKQLSTIEELGRRLVSSGADRQSALLAVGGGVTGDMVGFLASIFMRGIPHFQIPTTLLAQVDSSVGGKTGVNLPEGKNLLGTFHQPREVWIDPQLLQTLPALEFRQGMAEVIKTAMIGDASLWRFLEQKAETIKARDETALERVIGACCELKAKVVERDEKEAGHRRVLNLGHTVGHALERLSGYAIPHGDAVSMGLMASASLAVELDCLDRDCLDRLEELCVFWELPVRIPESFSSRAVLTALQTDKKRLGDTLHFILPVGLGQVVDCENPDMGCLMKVLDGLAESR